MLRVKNLVQLNKGYDARVVKTNETINGTTGWFRVIASSFDDKASAVQSRQCSESFISRSLVALQKII
mgnify:CR=1 FL=1